MCMNLMNVTGFFKKLLSSNCYNFGGYAIPVSNSLICPVSRKL